MLLNTEMPNPSPSEPGSAKLPLQLRSMLHWGGSVSMQTKIDVSGTPTSKYAMNVSSIKMEYDDRKTMSISSAFGKAAHTRGKCIHVIGSHLVQLIKISTYIRYDYQTTCAYIHRVLPRGSGTWTSTDVADC